jgi:hypothetical protein
MVPKGELDALKVSLGQEIDTLKRQLGELRGKHDLASTEATAKAARVTELEQELAKAKDLQTELDKVKADLVSSETSRQELATAMLNSRREALVRNHGYKAEDLANYTADQLALIEEALNKRPGGAGGNGNQPGGFRSQTFDRGGSSGGADGREGMGSQEMISSALEEMNFAGGNARLR